ncbi:MAG: helix-turn-helix transcriptional regulator, partial [Clostridia bacterium]
LSLRFMRQLHQSLTMSDRAAACDGLHRVLFASELPQADLRMRFDTLRMLLLIVAHDQGQTLADLPAYRPEETPEALYAMLEKAALALCDRLTLGRGERHSARGDAVCAYAQAHYTQSDCCPATLAAYFVLSEKTLYTLLKEQTGVSPATYLQNLRMEHAARLLRETDLSVQQISEASGFAAFNTYYKAFKRLYGVTPSQYREQEGTQGTE